MNKENNENNTINDIDNDSFDSTIHQPADKLFKDCMADARVAKDMFLMCLPKEILNKVDLSHLKLMPQSYITPRYQHKHVDVLYETKIDGELGYIYVLSEHQSEPDPLMPLRIMEYVLCIIRHHLKQHNCNGPYPVVYPFIFYTGAQPYHYSTDFFQGFDDKKAIAQSILNSPFQLIQTRDYTDNIKDKHMWSGALAYLYKVAQSRDIINALASMHGNFRLIEAQQRGSDMVVFMLDFVLRKVDYSEFDAVIEQMQDIVNEQSGEKLMTIAERLIQKGQRRGEHIGELRGEQRGIQKTLQSVSLAKKLFTEGTPITEVHELTELPLETLEELQS